MVYQVIAVSVISGLRPINLANLLGVNGLRLCGGGLVVTGAWCTDADKLGRCLPDRRTPKGNNSNSNSNSTDNL